MQLKTLTLAALAGIVVSQGTTPDLVTLLSNQTELSNLTTYLQLFPDLVGQLSQAQNITLLAPSNDAFTQLMNSSAGEALAANDTEAIQALFTYHVLNGSYANISEVAFIPTLLGAPYANVTGGQVVHAVPEDDSVSFYSGLLTSSAVSGGPLNFTGGVVHIIDTVLMIPPSLSESAIELNLTYAAGALINASLVETVDGLTDATFFIPDNDAFSAIGSALANLTTEQLADILTYHVVQGQVLYSTDLGNVSVATVQGNNITVTVDDDGDVFVNGAKVTVPDVLVANGVVHVIDNVLNPANATGPSDPDADEGESGFPGASSGTPPFTAPTPTGTAATATAEAPTSEGGAQPMMTGAMGAAALFGGMAAVMNL